MNLKCYVVTRARNATEPLFVSVDLDPRKSFQQAKSFVLAFNRASSTSRTVIRPATSELTWDHKRTVSPKRSA